MSDDKMYMSDRELARAIRTGDVSKTDVFAKVENDLRSLKNNSGYWAKWERKKRFPHKALNPISTGYKT